VGRSPGKEIGFFPLQLTETGQNDPLFEGIEGDIEVFQWHEDMSQIPSEAKLLALSPMCSHQAFKVGPHAYGLQFHLEITEETIQKWADAYFSSEDASLTQQKFDMMEDYRVKKEVFHKVRDRVYNNFLKMVICYKKLK
jgi:GMP synthase (glutamine-hydrolysing)